MKMITGKNRSEKRRAWDALFAAGDHVEQFDRIGDESGFGERGADMLGGARTGGIDGVQVHLAVVGDVAADHRALRHGSDS